MLTFKYLYLFLWFSLYIAKPVAGNNVPKDSVTVFYTYKTKVNQLFATGTPVKLITKSNSHIIGTISKIADNGIDILTDSFYSGKSPETKSILYDSIYYMESNWNERAKSQRIFGIGGAILFFGTSIWIRSQIKKGYLINEPKAILGYMVISGIGFWGGIFGVAANRQSKLYPKSGTHFKVTKVEMFALENRKEENRVKKYLFNNGFD